MGLLVFSGMLVLFFRDALLFTATGMAHLSVSLGHWDWAGLIEACGNGVGAGLDLWAWEGKVLRLP